MRMIDQRIVLLREIAMHLMLQFHCQNEYLVPINPPGYDWPHGTSAVSFDETTCLFRRIKLKYIEATQEVIGTGKPVCGS